jgi:hypothetical protein
LSAKSDAATSCCPAAVALSSDGLEAVAEVYRAAWKQGELVTNAVAEAFGIAGARRVRIMMASAPAFSTAVGVR